MSYRDSRTTLASVRMVKFQLSIKANLENVTDLEPAAEDFEFFFKVKCNSCNEVHDSFVALNRVDTSSMSGSRGNANFVWKCSFCGRENSASFEPQAPQPYTADSNGQFAPLLTIDCRGLEFGEFDPRGTWRCKGIDSGMIFSDVEMSEREWTDYDEKAAQPVGIMEFESTWRRV